MSVVSEQMRLDEIGKQKRGPLPGGSLSALQIGAESFASNSGGLNRYYQELLQHLPAVGVVCKGLVVGGNEQRRDGAIFTFASKDAPLLQRWNSERAAINAELAGAHFDLIVSHFALYAVPALRKLSPALPLVVHFHGPWAAEAREEGEGRIGYLMKLLVERRVYRRANRLIVLSEAFAGIARRDFGIAPELIRVIPGGINCDRFEINESRATARAKLGWPADRPIVLAVRRLVRRVGLENLIDAMVEVRRRAADVLLMIAGTGPMRQALESRIAERGLCSHVRLVGFVPDADLPRAYRAADVSVVPSVALEGFGLTAGESLASGTPVLVTPVGGLPEVVGGLGGSLVFPGIDSMAMATTLAERLRQPDQLPDADTCRRYVRQHFDWSIIARQVRAVYQEAPS